MHRTNIIRKYLVVNGCYSLTQKYSSSISVNKTQLTNNERNASLEPKVIKKDRNLSPALLPSEKEAEEKKKLRETILSAPNTESVLNIYINQKEEFDLDHYVDVVQSLSQLLQIDRDSENNYMTLHEKVEFQSLCYWIWKVSPQLEASMVLRIYKCLQDIKVPGDSLIMQSLLQITRHHINLLTIKELILLHILLNKTVECNLKQALQLALPRVLENSINFYFPKTLLSFNELSQLLQICIIGEVSGLDRVLNHIYRRALPELLLDKDNPAFQSKLSSLLSNLLDLPLSQFQHNQKVLKMFDILSINCLNYLTETNMTNIQKEVILSLLRKLGKCYSKGSRPSLLHYEFLASVNRIALELQWDVTTLCRVVEAQLKLHYLDDTLMATLSSKLIEDRNISLKPDLNTSSLISALATSNINLEDANVIVRRLTKRVQFPYENMKISWIRLALELLHLNFISEEFFRTVLDEKFLRRYLHFRMLAKREFLDLLRLDKVLKTKNLGNEFKISSELISQAEVAVGPPPRPSFRGILEQILGSGEYLLSSIVTPNQNYVDHLIVLDENFTPIRFPNPSENVFNFETLRGSHSNKSKIAVIEIPDSWTIRPGHKIRGYFKAEIKLIEDEGFTVIPLFEHEVEDYQEETLRYITQKLRKCGIKC